MSFTPNAGTSPHTEWFNASILEPGQPGVFQVVTEEQRRYSAMLADYGALDSYGTEPLHSYFDGKTFGPVRRTAELAFKARQQYNAYPGTITHFRGLSFDHSTL